MRLHQLLGLFLFHAIGGGDINPGNPLAGRHLQVVAMDVRIKTFVIGAI